MHQAPVAGTPLSVGFPPRIPAAMRVLVLGSLPGVRSLELQQYYANPHNRFWRAVAAVTRVEPAADYATRLAGLLDAGVGLWDVLASGERAGSLDQSIVAGTEVPNDLGDVVGAHPGLRAILLNGRSVESLFHRFIIPRAFWSDAGPAIVTLPSTSPAHAAMPPSQVIEAWRATLRRFLGAR